MKNAANFIPGQFEAKGHDYRADLARFSSARSMPYRPATTSSPAKAKDDGGGS